MLNGKDINKVVSINLGQRSYDIYIGAGLLDNLNDYLPEDVDEACTAFIVTDENVQPYANKVRENLIAAGHKKTHMLTLPAGESTKSLANLEKVTSWMLENRISRSAVVFAVGGGVIGDLTGFASSIIMRGVSYVQVPTSLLAQVDSSVGGKTGINTPFGKNLIGSFHQPIAVIADINTLKTLPHRELLAGYAEVVKYGLIGNHGFFDWLDREGGAAISNLNGESIVKAIEVSCKEKAEMVQADEREQGKRALLNLGHTFGHALEAAAGYDGRLLHGEAVAIGTVMAFDLASRLDLCEREDLERVEEHFARIGLPTHAAMLVDNMALNVTVDELIEIMRLDKKVLHGMMTFILPRRIGNASILRDIPEDEVRSVIADSLGNVKRVSQWKSVFSSLS